MSGLLEVTDLCVLRSRFEFPWTNNEKGRKIGKTFLKDDPCELEHYSSGRTFWGTIGTRRLTNYETAEGHCRSTVTWQYKSSYQLLSVVLKQLSIDSSLLPPSVCSYGFCHSQISIVFRELWLFSGCFYRRIMKKNNKTHFSIANYLLKTWDQIGKKDRYQLSGVQCVVGRSVDKGTREEKS